MLDLFAIFTRGGALLWTLQFTALRHSPVEALNALIRSCLLEERSGDNTYTYVPKMGAQQALKWTFHNGLGLVFVAVYQKALSLLYVDDLLTAVKREFTSNYYKPNVLSYPEFTAAFNRIYRECEANEERLRSASAAKPAIPNGNSRESGHAIKGASADEQQQDGEEDEEADAQAQAAVDGGSPDEDAGAFDLSKLKGKKGMRGGRSSHTGSKPPPPPSKKKEDDSKKTKKPRTWTTMRSGNTEPENLDFSRPADLTAGSESDRGQGGWTTDGDVGYTSAAGSIRRSRMEEEDDASQVDLDDLVARGLQDMDINATGGKAGAAGGKAAAQPRGVLGSFMSNLAIRVVGKQSLAAEDLAPALADMKRKLMERNVAEEIAQNICNSVAKSLEGKKLASFTGVGTFVARAFEDALAGILNKRTVDMLLDIKKAQAHGKPYVVVFCGVNGVGKSTNLAKIAFWLGQHNIKVLIAACDTFRAGAVEQLKTHCARLQVPLYERGYEKDPAKVANEAIKQAEREGRDVVLVDTAGRMQDNEPLMRALSNLINVNNPNLVLFVGEALVGNDAVDQLVKFNRALHDLAPPTATRRHAIDGIVLTKFDTIDDKVGAAVSMVYASGAPIMFLGCGQTYADLKRLHVRSVVNALLK